MMGSYLQWDDLGKDENEIPAYPHYYEGKMHSAGYCDINPVTSWVLKHHGINLLGSTPKNLNFEATKKVLLDYVLKNMNTYWAGRIKHIEKMNNDTLSTQVTKEETEWSVLGTLRQYYTLSEGDILSKTDAGEYGMQHRSLKYP